MELEHARKGRGVCRTPTRHATMVGRRRSLQSQRGAPGRTEEHDDGVEVAAEHQIGFRMQIEIGSRRHTHGRTDGVLNERASVRLVARERRAVVDPEIEAVLKQGEPAPHAPGQRAHQLAPRHQHGGVGPSVTEYPVHPRLHEAPELINP